MSSHIEPGTGVHIVYAQEWEERERGWGARPDGYTLHLDFQAADAYVKSVYAGRGDDAPDEYDAAVGSPKLVHVTPATYAEVTKGMVRVGPGKLAECLDPRTRDADLNRFAWKSSRH